MSSTAVYGDPTNISVFEDTKKFVTKTGLEVLSTNAYAKNLVKVYEEYFSDISSVSKYSLDTGEFVSGKIVSISETEITLDVGHREFAYVSIAKDKITPSDFLVGQDIDVMILEDQETSEYLKASITEKVKKELYDDMSDRDSNKVYDATVLNLSNNGYDLDISGLKVFMPGSLGGINRLVDFDSLVGQSVKVMAVKNNNNYSKYKNTLIVSHREYLRTLIPEEISKLEVGCAYTGKVTDTTRFGVFVEFSSTEGTPRVLTGLIHKDEFDEALKEFFEAGSVQPGVEIEFFLKEIINPKRIILSRIPLDEAVDDVIEYTKDQLVKGRVTKVTTYGAFVKFGKNTSGLVHISKIEDISTVERGDKVKCQIININNGKYDLTFV